MGRQMKRMAALFVALLLMINLCAFADGVRVDAKVELPFGAAEGFMETGMDEDGCQTILLNVEGLGKMFVQTGANLVFNYNDTGAMEITPEALMGAVTILNYVYNGQMPIDTAVRLYDYITGPDYYNDIMAIDELSGEISNKISQIAMDRGLLTIHENGDVEIKVTKENLPAYLDAILSAIKADEELYTAITGLKYFEAFGMGYEETVAEMLKEYGEIFKELAGGEVADAGLYVAVEAGGNLNLDAYIEEAAAGARQSLTMYGDFSGAGIAYTKIADGAEEKFEFNVKGNDLVINAYRKGGEGNSYSLTLKADNSNTELTGDFDVNGVKAQVSAKSGMMGSDVKLEIADADNAFKLEGTQNLLFNKQEMKMELKQGETEETLVYAENMNEMKLTYARKEAGVNTANAELTLLETCKLTANWADNKLEAELAEKEEGLNLDGTLECGEYAYTFNAVYAPAEETLEAKLSGGINGEITHTASLKMDFTLEEQLVDFLMEYEINGVPQKISCYSEENKITRTGKAEMVITEMEYHVYSEYDADSYSAQALLSGSPIMDMEMTFTDTDTETVVKMTGFIGEDNFEYVYGAEAAGENEARLFAEGTLNGVTCVAEIPVKYTADGNKNQLEASLNLDLAGQQLEAVKLLAGWEENEEAFDAFCDVQVAMEGVLTNVFKLQAKVTEVSGFAEHVSGSELTHEDIARALYALIESYR